MYNENTMLRGKKVTVTSLQQSNLELYLNVFLQRCMKNLMIYGILREDTSRMIIYRQM